MSLASETWFVLPGTTLLRFYPFQLLRKSSGGFSELYRVGFGLNLESMPEPGLPAPTRHRGRALSRVL